MYRILTFHMRLSAHTEQATAKRRIWLADQMTWIRQNDKWFGLYSAALLTDLGIDMASTVLFASNLSVHHACLLLCL